MRFVTGCVMCGGPQTKTVGTWRWAKAVNLHGLTVSVCQRCGERETEIPSADPLIAFVTANPEARDLAFIEGEWREVA
jgi:hypothetical protein